VGCAPALSEDLQMEEPPVPPDTAEKPIPKKARAAASSLGPCAECGSTGPFGIGKPVTLPAGPTPTVVPVVCRICGDVRLLPAELIAPQDVKG
jgi:hypothetical protein